MIYLKSDFNCFSNYMLYALIIANNDEFFQKYFVAYMWILWNTKSIFETWLLKAESKETEVILLEFRALVISSLRLL